jgi:hypothetical protein
MIDDKGTVQSTIEAFFKSSSTSSDYLFNTYIGYLLLRTNLDSAQPIDETMPVTDEQEELLSSTEFDESLMGNEKQWSSPELETGKRSKTNIFTIVFRSYRWLIDTFLLFVIIGLSLLLRHQWKKSPSSSWQVGGDFTGAGLKCLSPRNTCRWLYGVLI